MAGDGISLQTSLVQLGSVAKTQARGQQTAQGPAAAPDAHKQEVAPVQKVRETEKTDQSPVDPDQRRQNESQDGRDPEDRDADDKEIDAAGADEQRKLDLGALVDTKA